MRTLTTLGLLLSFLTLSAKHHFEPGYYITNDGQRIEGLIDNEDWRLTPSAFLFKKSIPGVDAHKIEMHEAKAFGVGDQLFQRMEIPVEISNRTSGNLSTQKEGKYEWKQVYVQVLLSGDISLYEYRSSYGTQFLYQKTSNDSIVNLLDKTYVDAEGRIRQNAAYRIQLWLNLRCSTTQMKDLEYLGYSRKQLVHYFQQYAACTNLQLQSHLPVSQKANFHLHLGVGTSFTQWGVLDPTTGYRDVYFEDVFNLRASAMAELSLPFSHYRWSILAGVYYMPINQSFERTTYVGRQKASINTHQFDGALAIGYSFLLAPKHAIKLSVGGLFPLSPDETLVLDVGDDYTFRRDPHPYLNIAYLFNSKFGISLMWEAPHQSVSSGQAESKMYLYTLSLNYSPF